MVYEIIKPMPQCPVNTNSSVDSEAPNGKKDNSSTFKMINPNICSSTDNTRKSSVFKVVQNTQKQP